jgi:hypothetical protein
LKHCQIFRKNLPDFQKKIGKFTPKICVLAGEIHENSHPNMSQKSARFFGKNCQIFAKNLEQPAVKSICATGG